MDEDLSISQLAEQNAPVLLMAERLVVCLRGCTLFATSRQASRLRLVGSANGFSSEMTLLANKGLDALVDACDFLNTMRLTARSMAKEGGTIDRLQSSIGIPAERKSHERLTGRLKQEIETCTSGGTELAKKLTSWREEVEKFQTVVSKTNEHYVLESEVKDNEIAMYGAEIESGTRLLEQVEAEGAKAKSSYDESQAMQKRLIDNAALPETLGPSTFLGMAYAGVRLTWNQYHSNVYAQDIKKTQEEVERRRQDAEQYKLKIEEAEIELRKVTGESRQLSNFMNALEPTLRQLVFLTDNLRALVMGFTDMKPYLNRLIARQNETNSISQDARDEPASYADIRDFRDNAQEMSEWTLRIEHLAWLYASIIENVLISGLETVQGAAHGEDDDGSSGTLDFFHVAQRRQMYLQGDTSSCNTVKTQVDTRYEQEKLAMEVRHGAERKRFAKEAEKARKQEKKRAQQKAGSGKLKFFVRG